ncbi:MAG: sbcC-2 [Deltaproteobacteria bacterium]|nr:sbcC-2 [Deltaproteobacteria bacterium]
MLILSVHLKNIKSHRDTELAFSPGINVLSGPNGVGKSTVFEAIGYALFGVDARDFVSNVDRFLTIGAKRGEISVTFQTGSGETWQASRTVGTPAKWLLAKESGGMFEVEEHSRIEETEARVAELLGLDNGRPLAEQFKLVIGPFQNEFLGPFIIKQPTKRQEAFDEILGIDAWRKTYKGTSALLTAVQEKMKILTVEVTAKQEQLAVLPERESALQTLKTDLSGRELLLKEKAAALAALNRQLEELDSRQKTINALSTEMQILEERVKEGGGKITDQRLRVDEAHAAQKIIEASKAGKEAFERAEEQLKLLRERDQQRRGLEQAIAGLEKESARLTQALGHERAEIEIVAKQLLEEDARLAAASLAARPDPKLVETAAGLPGLRLELEQQRAARSLLEGRRESLLEGKEKLAGGICPFFQEECRNIAGSAPRDVFSVRTTDLERRMKELNTRIEELALLVKEAESAEQELKARSIRLQEIDKQSAAVAERRKMHLERSAGLEKLAAQQATAVETARTRKADLQVFAELDAQIERAEQERLQHQTARDAFNAALKDAQDCDNRNQLLEKMLKLLEELKQQVVAKQAELSLLKEGYQPELHLQARQSKDLHVAETATLRQQITGLGKDRTRLENELIQLQKIKVEIDGRLAEIKAFEEKEKLVKFLRNHVFKNVSAQLSERFREEISLRADRIYRTIAEADEELYWGDNYQIVLRDMAEGVIRERSDDQLSGGQTMSAVVALRLALLQTIGSRIAFFDEPTSNLDVSRRENLAYAFRAIDVGREEVTEHWYDQLFLISHDVAFTEITDQTLQLGE